MPGKCHYQDNWTERENWIFWLRPGKDKFHAFCSFCNKEFDISHSGINCVKTHAKGKKHQLYSETLTNGKQSTLHLFSVNKDNKGPTNIANESRPTYEERPSTSSDTDCRPLSGSVLEVDQNRPITGKLSEGFLVRETVTKSEIMWSAYCVATQTSTRYGGLAVNLFPKMFPDSSIANKMQLQKDKIAYSVYGLAPYFSHLVTEGARRSSVFALSIDESLNEICQKQQMDFMINFWDTEQDRVCTRYLTSSFLERSTASDLLDSILTCIGESNLSLENLVQLSTDGPNVNLKLIFDINSHLKNFCSNEHQLLDIGTCSLHIVNGAYKTCHSKVGWNLNKFLRGLYRLFKNFPSRRAIYTQTTGSALFPKKFCSVRWTENSSVIRRALDMMSHLKTYIKDVREVPVSENFDLVKKYLCEDPLLEAKLNFSAMVAEELEEFLVRFQRNDPLLPFLQPELFSLMKSICGRFLKKKIMDTVTSVPKLKQIDLTCNDNFLPLESVDIGFGARSCLKRSKEIDIQKFRLDCKKFLVCLYEKLMDKSPLKKRVVLGSTCLNPMIMCNPILRKSRAQTLIEELVNHGQLSPAEGDVIVREYTKFCNHPAVLERLKSYNWKKERLDILFSSLFSILRPDEVSSKLKLFFQRILVCFHGNAAVERSFSYNKHFLVENLQDKSLVARRLLHDHITCLEGGLSSLNITKRMVQEFRNASVRRREGLKAKKEAEDKVLNEKKRAIEEMKELKMKKQKVLAEKGEELALIESQLASLKRKI